MSKAGIVGTYRYVCEGEITAMDMSWLIMYTGHSGL